MNILRHVSFLALVSLLALAAQAAAPAYQIDSARSSLGFSATQEGAKFDGSFRKFTAKISFSPADLAASCFDVTVDPASADTQDADRDGTLKGPDFFDVTKFKSGHFVTRAFSKVDATHFTAAGKLTIRNVTRDVSIAFTFTERNEGGKNVAYLAGSANLKRLEFGLGQGDYADTGSLADAVQVRFNLRLLPAAATGKMQIPTPPPASQAQ
jgi:polyisoprenoid-binding protein YceI